MITHMLHLFAQVQNCPQAQGNNCLTNIPEVVADQSTVSTMLGILFGALAAMAVIIIIVQGIKFALSQGDPEKAATARKGVLYALVGLGIALSAELIVRLVINGF